MGKKKNKFLLVFVIIIVLLLCSFVGFYMLYNMEILAGDSVAEKVNSNIWNISVKISEPIIDGNSKINVSDIKKTNINVSGQLNENSTITYDLSINNNGSIDAFLYNIVNSGADNINVDYLVEGKKLKNGYVLRSGETIKGKLVITLNGSDSIDFNLNSQLIFNQYIDQ